MPTITFEMLENSFEACIEKNRKRKTSDPCPREALFAPAFFDIGDDREPAQAGLVPNKLPFETIWIVTNFKGLAICAYLERMDIGGGETIVRPDYLWYPTLIDGVRHTTSEAEMEDKVTFIIDRALAKLLTSHLAEVDSEVEQRLNRGRAKARNNPIPDLPKFIRITGEIAVRNEPKGGTHASPQAHMREAHWRTYKASGKCVWINEMAIKGGSPVPRNYRVDHRKQGAI